MAASNASLAVAAAAKASRSAASAPTLRAAACPFLRALARAGPIGAQVPLGPFAELVVRAGALRRGDALRLCLRLPAVGAVAYCLRNVARNVLHGFRPYAMRKGPIDKQGGGSRIFAQDGSFDEAEFERFVRFGTLVGPPPEMGWRQAEIKRYLDARVGLELPQGRALGRGSRRCAVVW